jgi:hypothetical protein
MTPSLWGKILRCRSRRLRTISAREKHPVIGDRKISTCPCAIYELINLSVQ